MPATPEHPKIEDPFNPLTCLRFTDINGRYKEDTTPWDAFMKVVQACQEQYKNPSSSDGEREIAETVFRWVTDYSQPCQRRFKIDRVTCIFPQGASGVSVEELWRKQEEWKMLVGPDKCVSDMFAFTQVGRALRKYQQIIEFDPEYEKMTR
jgi:hypothetical protein